MLLSGAHREVGESGDNVERRQSELGVPRHVRPVRGHEDNAITSAQRPRSQNEDFAMRQQRSGAEYRRVNFPETLVKAMKEGTSIPLGGKAPETALEMLDDVIRCVPPPMRRGSFWQKLQQLRSRLTADLIVREITGS